MCKYILSMNFLTRVQFCERPLTAHKGSARSLFLFLSQAKIDFVIALRHTVVWHAELELVAVALVLPVHEDKGGKARSNVAFGLEADAKRDFGVWHSDEALDGPITVTCAILLKWRSVLAELDRAYQLLELRHGYVNDDCRSWSVDAMLEEQSAVV